MPEMKTTCHHGLREKQAAIRESMSYRWITRGLKLWLDRKFVFQEVGGSQYYCMHGMPRTQNL